MISKSKDRWAGILLTAFGGAYAALAMSTLRTGEISRMGPGYFPTVLGFVMAGLGILILLRSGPDGEPRPGRPSWRGVVLIGLAPVAFGWTIERLGMIPAVAIATLLCSYASSGIGWQRRVMITIGLVVFCVIVFRYGVGLSIPLLGSWLQQ